MKSINKLTVAAIIFVLLSSAAALAGDSKNIDVIKKLDAACNSHNLDAALALFADNAMVKLLPPPPDGGVYTGKEQISNWMKSLLAVSMWNRQISEPRATR